MSIRAEQPEDGGSVTELLLSAFGDHGRAVVALADDLRSHRASSISLIAEYQSRVVGFALLSGCWVDSPQRLVSALVLSPLAVSPEFQGRGIGRELITSGLDAADRDGAPMVFLEGDPAYYSRMGFVAGRNLGLRRPSLRIPEAAFQVKALSHYDSSMTGSMVYPDTWWKHDAVGLR